MDKQKSTILSIVLLFICLSSCVVKPAPIRHYEESIKDSRDPGGFRGITWGTKLDTLFDMVHLHTDTSFGGIEVYIRAGDKMKIGAADIKSITYEFWGAKYFSTVITTEDYTNWIGLRDAIFAKFGKGYQSNKYIQEYFWFLPHTRISLEYNQFSKKATLYLCSRQLSDQAQREREQRAIEGARKDF